MDPPSRAVGTYFEETIKTAELIWEQKSGPLHLCYSGGLDSKFVLAVLRHIGIWTKQLEKVLTSRQMFAIINA